MLERRALTIEVPAYGTVQVFENRVDLLLSDGDRTVRRFGNAVHDSRACQVCRVIAVLRCRLDPHITAAAEWSKLYGAGNLGRNREARLVEVMTEWHVTHPGGCWIRSVRIALVVLRWDESQEDVQTIQLDVDLDGVTAVILCRLHGLRAGVARQGIRAVAAVVRPDCGMLGVDLQRKPYTRRTCAVAHIGVGGVDLHQQADVVRARKVERQLGGKLGGRAPAVCWAE